jgi:hypothetical protein
MQVNAATFTAATMLLGTIPHDAILRDRVDLVEVNHFCNDQAQLVFDQIIFYEWCQGKGRHEIVAWRLLKNPRQTPQRDFRTGEHSALWLDGEAIREVRAQTVRETWTQVDPELVGRETLPKEQRKELSRRTAP